MARPAPQLVAEQRPVASLRGVGPALAEKLAKLGVTQVQDLLFVLPTRYEDRTQISAIGALRPGARAVVEGEVQLTEVVYRRRRQLLCRITRRHRLPDAALLLFLRRAAGRPGPRHAHPLLRRGAPRPAGAGDRASGVPAPRRRGARRSRKCSRLSTRPPRACRRRACAHSSTWRCARPKPRACATGFRRSCSRASSCRRWSRR